MPAPRVSLQTITFRDRADAAHQLAQELRQLDLTAPLVLGIPRGGIAIGATLAEELGAELDAALARKLRAPRQPELAIGAVSEDGELHLSPHAQLAGATEEYLEKERQDRLAELKRRSKMFREARPPARIEGRSVILTDDGIATGSTMLAAAESLQAKKPHQLIIAVPVMPAGRVEDFRRACDQLVCLSAPEDFMAIGQFYENFRQVDDETACNLLRRFAQTG
ncbi:MAG: phosphoribosyltransferase [Planctomycetes bacterium]|nr:phosphoribosyltransferase [Planctomycetota bacterium]